MARWKELCNSAINGMLAGLDPHSSYMDSKSFRDMQVQSARNSRASETELIDSVSVR
jgi:C-terminal processing protease CtpA/Prc